MLLRQQIPISPQSGHLFKAFGQGAEPLGGRRHGNVPVLIGQYRIAALHRSQAPLDVTLDSLSLAHNHHHIGGQIPAKQQILRVLEKILQQRLPHLGIGLRVPFPVGFSGENGHEDQAVALGPQIQVQLSCRLIDLFHAQTAGNQLFHELSPGILLVFLRIHQEFLLIIPLFPFVFDLVADLPEHIHKGRLGDGLEEILLHTDLNGLLGILKIIIAGDNHDLHLRELLQHQLAQSKAVHKGHTDIRNQHVRQMLSDQRQRHFSIRRFPHKGIADAGPGNGIPQRFPNNTLILNQKYSKHNFPCLSF